MDASDEALVGAAGRGDRGAYEALIRRYAPRVAAVCRSRLGPRGPVDDFVQETFLRGWRGLASLEDPAKFGSWLHGIAVRGCLDWLKARERGQGSIDAAGREPAAPPPGPPEAELDRRDRLIEGVRALPDLYREAVELFYYGRMSYAEMGAMLGITPAAVNVRLTKARAMLRERMSRVTG